MSYNVRCISQDIEQGQQPQRSDVDLSCRSLQSDLNNHNQLMQMLRHVNRELNVHYNFLTIK